MMEVTGTNNEAFIAAQTAVQSAFQSMKDMEGDIGELLDTSSITPAIVGQILMNVLPLRDEPAARLNRGQKVFWLEVAEYMGPDWINELRRIAAFMDKVDQF